jgi:hypothetical protein
MVAKVPNAVVQQMAAKVPNAVVQQMAAKVPNAVVQQMAAKVLNAVVQQTVAKVPTVVVQQMVAKVPNVVVTGVRLKDVRELNVEETDGWRLSAHPHLCHRPLVEPRLAVLESARIQRQPRPVGCFCSISWV